MNDKFFEKIFWIFWKNIFNVDTSCIYKYRSLENQDMTMITHATWLEMTIDNFFHQRAQKPEVSMWETKEQDVSAWETEEQHYHYTMHCFLILVILDIFHIYKIQSF
jgi:hypothetical protein